MFINIKILARNLNSLKKFLTLFKEFCIKNSKKRDLFILKKKLTKTIKKKRSNKNHAIFPLQSRFAVNNCNKMYRYKMKRKKYITKKKLNGLLNYCQQKRERKVFTTLKSPHVNKTAQEQIEYRLFSKRIDIFSFQILKFLILTKKIQMKLYPDIKIQIKFVLNNKTIKKMKLISLNPNNYKTTLFSYSKERNPSFKMGVQKSNNKQIPPYLKLFDIYGEFFLNNQL